MKKRVLSLFLAITLCLSLTPTGALAAEGQPPEQTVSVTQEAQIPAPAAEEEEEEKKTTSAENGADENDPPANPEENPTENAPAAAEKNTADEETDEETAAATGRDESKADGSPSDDDAAKVQDQLVMAAAAGPDEPTMMGQNNLLALADAEQDAAEGENGEGSGGTHYVAESGGTQYETVQEILNKMDEGEITLLGNVKENIDVYATTTIHMGSFSITGDVSVTLTESNESLTLNGGTVKGNVEVDGGTFTMTAPTDAAAAIDGKLNVISGSAYVSGAKIGVKGTLVFGGTDMTITGTERAVALDTAAEPKGVELYGSTDVNGETSDEAVFNEEQGTYTVSGEAAKKLSTTQVDGEPEPEKPTLTIDPTSANANAGETATFTATYTGTDALQAYIQKNGLDTNFDISTPTNNGDDTYTITVKIAEETPTGDYTLYVHEVENNFVQATATIHVTGKDPVAEVIHPGATEGTKYFSLSAALNAAQDGDTIELLTDVTGTTVVINNQFIFDLNGHSVDTLSVDAKATIKDSGTTKGRIGKVTVSNEKVTDLTLGSLLEEGYAFRDANDEWIDVAGKEAQAVSVQKAPIQSLTIETDKDTYTPGETITLTANAQMSGTETVDSYQWTYDGMAMEQNPAGSSLQAYQTQQKARGGTHTFTCIAHCGGYAFTSQPYTITVDPIDLSGATVQVRDLTYNGSQRSPAYYVTVTLSGEPVQYNYYDVEATPQTDAGEYTLTITGTGNYTGKIENVPWKINPAELTVSAPSEVKKAYDGTTNATVTPTFNGLKNNENLTAADYSVTAAFEDAKVGFKKIVTGKVTLKQTDTAKNYVLKDDGNFSTDNGIIAKAAAPTVQPVELTIYNGVQKDYFVDLPPLPDLDEGKFYGKVDYSVNHPITLPEGYTAQSAVVADPDNLGTYRLLLHMTQTGSLTGEIGTVTIPVTTSNYQDINLTVKVKAVNQIIPEKVGTVSADAITYGQTLNDSTITFTGKMTDIAANEEVNGTFTWKDGAFKPDAGSYEARWLFTPDESYGGKYTTNTGDVTVTVNKADAALTAPTANTLTYNGTEQALVSAGTAIGGTMQYRLGEIGDFSTDIPKAENAGNYTVYYKVVGDNNHNDSTVMNLTVTIDPMKIDHAKFVKDISKAYDGKPTFDLVAEDKASYLTFYDAHMQPISVPAEAYEISGVNFGTQDADHNFVPSAEVGDKPGIQFTVEFKSSNYVLQADDVDEPALALTYTQYGGANFTITKGDLIFSGITITNVPVQLLVTNDLERTYEIDLPKYRWPLAAPCEYGNVSYTLKENTLSSAYYSGGAEITAENKLILPINQVATDQELPPVGKVVVTVTSGNYKDYTITINVSPRNKVAPVPSGTIRASSITYGESLSKSKITGWMQHPTAHNDVKGVFRWKEDTIRPNAGDYVAEWIFIPDESYGGAYLTATGTATVTVNPKVVTVSGITANDKAYDGTTDAELVFSNATFDGIQGNDTLTATAKGKFANANVGNQPVTISDLILGGDSAANYVLATEGNQTETTATITAKEVTVSGITANDKAYDGTTNATLDCSNAKFNGILENDKLTVTAKGVFKKAEAGKWNVAISDLTLGGHSVANYVLAESGNQTETTATITAKQITVSITPNGGSYGGIITPATATANDVVGEDAPEITLTYTGTANDSTEYNGTTPPTKAGTYTIKASTTNANYTLVADTAIATFTVAKRRATVTPDNKSKVYEEKDPDLTYAVSGVLAGETLKGITLTRAEGENAGEYAITATADAGANPNYDVKFAEGTFTIKPKSIQSATVVLGKGLAANGAEQTQTVEKVLLNDKELPADSYTVAGNTATDPGSHTLTITAKGNYTGTVEQTYVIIPAKAEDAPGEDIAISSGKVKVVVKSEGTVPPATLLTNKAELLAMLVDSGDITADELAQIADGASVDIALTVKEANVSAEIKTAMAQAAKGCTIGQYLDISLFKYMTVNGKQQDGVALHTTKNALTISVAVPDALINTNSAVNRTYCIVRNHEGTITVLDAAFDAASKTLTFKTDRFSDYAIAYKDTAVPSSGSNPGSNNSSNGIETKKNEVAAPTPAPTPASTSKPSTITAMPQTGDTSNPTLYVVLLVASLLGLAVVFVCKKRNNK